MGEALLINKILFSAAMLACLGTAEASAAEGTCKDLGELAAQIMDLRQKEVPLSQVMEVNEADDPSPLLREIILAAYERTSFSTDEYRQQAIAEFRNEVELQCYQAQ